MSLVLMSLVLKMGLVSSAPQTLETEYCYSVLENAENDKDKDFYPCLKHVHTVDNNPEYKPDFNN